MRRVRLYGLEHLSLFSSITDKQVDNIILDFISRHGSTWVNHGRTLSTGILQNTEVHCTKEADKRQPKQGRFKEHSFEMGCFSFAQSLLCPMAKLVVALRWPPLVDSLEICYPRMYRWVFKENHFLTL